MWDPPDLSWEAEMSLSIAEKDVEQANLSDIGATRWQTVWKFLITLNINVPYGPAISFLGIDLRNGNLASHTKKTCMYL